MQLTAMLNPLALDTGSPPMDPSGSMDQSCYQLLVASEHLTSHCV
jgi:hypothetical protein